MSDQYNQATDRSLNSITVNSWWARWCLKSPASQLFTQAFIQAQINKANLRDLKAVTSIVILLKLDSNQIEFKSFSPCDLEIWQMTSKNNRAPLLYHIKLYASFQIHRWSQTWVTVLKRPIWVKICDFFVPCDFEIWWMTLKNNRAPLLYYIKLCASFQSHGWIQTGITVRKRSIQVKIGNFLSRVALIFDGWPWKTIGLLFYTTSSIVQHFGATGEFKLELQSRNAQFGSKSKIFCPVWPWNLTDDLEKQYGTSSMLLQALCIIS